MCTYDLCDILFFIKSTKNPSNNFDHRTFIKFCHHSIKSSSCNKLEHVFTSSNKQRNNLFYFNRLPTIDLTKPFLSIKAQILWQHFMKTLILTTYTAFISLVPAASVQSTPSHRTLMHTIVSYYKYNSRVQYQLPDSFSSTSPCSYNYIDCTIMRFNIAL